MSARAARFVLLACTLTALLAACRDDVAPTMDAPAATPASVERSGPWQGGPEPVSGKLRSGITSWYRLVPAQPRPGEVFELRLRLEDVRDADASLSVSTSDGAQLAPGAVRRWRLPRDVPSELTLRLLAPAGDSYVHLATAQLGRSSVRSIRLPVGPASAGAASPARSDYGRDAQGGPIVRMQAEPASR